MHSFTNSLFGFKSRSLFNVRVLCGTALFAAMAIALRFVSINLSESLRISFTFLAVAASCYFFGLWPNVISAFFIDFFGFILHPDGPYVPVFALVIVMEAVIYALFFYGRDRISLWRVISAHALMVIVCQLLLNPWILSFMYDVPFWVMVTGRLLKNALLFPIECTLLYFLLKVCADLKKRSTWLR